MNKKKVSIILMFFIAILSTFVFVKNISNVEITNEVNNKSKKNRNLLTMNLEQTAGAGDYKTVTQNEWPTEGYKFNSELSRCENGSEISWDDVNKIVVMSGDTSDKCYVYFDIARPTLVDYVISQYTGTQGDNELYYHTSNLTNGAEDNSYRYAGANPNNYVCFGSDATTCPEDNLYRIIGVIDGSIKLVKATLVNPNLLGTDGTYNLGKSDANGSYSWSNLKSCTTTTAFNENLMFLANKNTIAVGIPRYGCNKWEDSKLNKINLNVNFIQTFSSLYSDIIRETEWGNGSSESKIGLFSYTDYKYAFAVDYWNLKYEGDYKNNNWLYKGNLCSYTITSNSSETTDVYAILNDSFYHADWSIGPNLGGQLTTIPTSLTCYIYPSFYLKSDVTYVSGTGTQSDPIRIN